MKAVADLIKNASREDGAWPLSMECPVSGRPFINARQVSSPSLFLSSSGKGLHRKFGDNLIIHTPYVWSLSWLVQIPESPDATADDERRGSKFGDTLAQRLSRLQENTQIRDRCSSLGQLLAVAHSISAPSRQSGRRRRSIVFRTFHCRYQSRRNDRDDPRCDPEGGKTPSCCKGRFKDDSGLTLVYSA
jgi:hypothetical protein